MSARRTRSSRSRTAAGPARGAPLVLTQLRQIVRAIQEQSASIEATVGLTGPQLWALREINGSPGGLSLGELAQRLVLHKANAGRLAERLGKRGLVHAERPASDRRVVLVRVTPEGRRIAERPVAGPPQASLLARLDRLPAKELADLRATLARLVQLLGAESVEPGPLFEDGATPGAAPGEHPRRKKASRRRR